MAGYAIVLLVSALVTGLCTPLVRTLGLIQRRDKPDDPALRAVRSMLLTLVDGSVCAEEGGASLAEIPPAREKPCYCSDHSLRALSEPRESRNPQDRGKQQDDANYAHSRKLSRQ